MTSRRRLAATTTAGFALVALTGCEAPAPGVTVVSGGKTARTEASTWCFEGQSPSEGNCASRAEDEAVLEVTPGQQVGIDVDKEVLERGWVLELADASGQGQPQRLEQVQEGHYFAFTAPNAGPEGLLLTVQAVGEAPDQPSGEWRFRLVPEGLTESE